jgi:soluble lytic murein transglycosylase-like protein
MPSIRWTAPALLLVALCACTQAAAQPPASHQAALPSVAAPATGAEAAVAPAATAPAQPVQQADRPTIKWLLYNAAAKYRINAGLVYAVAWWESGWNQQAVSATGAVGVMQVEPYAASSAGPLLLGRPADPRNLDDNIELGTAMLKEDLQRYDNDLVKALVAYNSGPGAIKDWAQLDPALQQYVLGIYKLAVQFDQGTGPA